MLLSHTKQFLSFSTRFYNYDIMLVLLLEKEQRAHYQKCENI